MRRSLAGVVVVLLAAAGLAFLAGGRTWVTATLSASVGGGRVVSRPAGVRGTDLTGVLSPLGLVALAAAAAVLATRGWARAAVGALLGVVGAGSLIAVGRLVASPRRPAQLALEARGPVGTVTGVARSVWLLLGVVPPLLVVLAGVLTTVLGRRWSSLSGRYESGPQPAAVRRAAPDDPAGAWAALDRGDDPTLD